MNRLKQIVEQISAQSQPPVHLWEPDHEGSIDIRIDASGDWYHEGELIKRDKLVALFASILWFEGGQHFLVTPVEKLAIEVEDAAYIIHQMEFVDDAWIVITNTHESVIIGEENPVELRQYAGQWVPYVNIRYDLWARVNRSLFFQWVDMALDAQEAVKQETSRQEAVNLSLTSNGYSFEVAR